MLSTLVSGGLPEAMAKSLVTQTQNGMPLLAHFVASQNSGRWDPDVSDDFKSMRKAYNLFRGTFKSPIAASNDDGENFVLSSQVSLADLPRLTKMGEIVDLSDEDGTYIEVNLPDGQCFVVTNQGEDVSSMPAFDMADVVSPDELLKKWWHEWEQYSQGYLDKDMFNFLRKRDIDPRRDNIAGGYNDESYRLDRTGNIEPEEWEGMSEVETITPSDDHRAAAPMHQWSESLKHRLIKAIGNYP